MSGLFPPPSSPALSGMTGMTGMTIERASAPDPCRLAAEIAARHTGIPIEHVMIAERGNRRRSSARALAMYLAHVGLGEPMRAVARGFGRHPSTVAHACGKIEERREVAGWDRGVAALEDEARRRMAEEATPYA